MRIYTVAFKPQAVKDLKSVPKNDANRIITKIEAMSQDLQGDVKRLTDFTPEYRLRVGDYRILSEIEGSVIVIYRVMHRRDVYR